MKRSRRKTKERISYILATLLAVHHITGYAFADDPAGEEDAVTSLPENAGKSVTISESDYLYVNGGKQVFTAEGTISVLLRLPVEKAEKIHILASGVNITLVIYDETAGEICGTYASEDGLMDVPFDAASGTYLLGFSGFGEAAVRVADEENTARIYAGEEIEEVSPPENTEDSAEETAGKSEEADGESEEVSGEPEEAPTEEGTEKDTELPPEETDKESFQKDEDTAEALEEPEEDLTEGAAAVTEETAEEDTEVSKAASAEGTDAAPVLSVAEVLSEGIPGETMTERSDGTREEAPVEGTAETPDETPAEGAAETQKETPVEGTAETQKETTGEGAAETQGAAPDEETAGTPEEATVEGTAETTDETPTEEAVEMQEAVPDEETAGTLDETPDEGSVETREAVPGEVQTETPSVPKEEGGNLIGGFVDWLIGNSSGNSPADPAADAQQQIPADPAEQGAEELSEEKTTGESEENPDETAGDELSGNTTEEIAEEGSDVPAQEPDLPAQEPDGPAEEIPEPEEEADESAGTVDEPVFFDTSVPVYCKLAAGETVSVLGILAEAGAPANMITGFAGETEGKVIVAEQNGDLLLTPYVSFDAIELYVKAGDFTAKDFAASEAIYTLILSNPDPSAAVLNADASEASAADTAMESDEQPDDAATEEMLSEEAASVEETEEMLSEEAASAEATEEVLSDEVSTEDSSEENLSGDSEAVVETSSSEEDETADISESVDEVPEEPAPFDPSIPIRYRAANNETVSTLTILAEAGAPANVITGFAGDTEGKLYVISQNSDWLLTPYTYFDSVELSVTATDYLSADPAEAEDVYTIILSNPDPAPVDSETGEQEEEPTAEMAEESAGDEAAADTVEEYAAAAESVEGADEAADTVPENGITIAVEHFADDEIHLYAENVDPAQERDLTFQWQYSMDNETWFDAAGATGPEYFFRLNETNSNTYWRLMVSGAEVSEEEPSDGGSYGEESSGEALGETGETDLSDPAEGDDLMKEASEE